MTNDLNQLPSSPLEESPPQDEPYDHGKNLETNNQPPPEREVNTMTQGDLDRLRKSMFLPVKDPVQAPQGR